MMTLLSIAHVHRAIPLLRLALLQFGLLAAAAPAQPPAIAGGGRPERRDRRPRPCGPLGELVRAACFAENSRI